MFKFNNKLRIVLLFPLVYLLLRDLKIRGNMVKSLKNVLAGVLVSFSVREYLLILPLITYLLIYKGVFVTVNLSILSFLLMSSIYEVGLLFNEDEEYDLSVKLGVSDILLVVVSRFIYVLFFSLLVLEFVFEFVDVNYCGVLVVSEVLLFLVLIIYSIVPKRIRMFYDSLLEFMKMFVVLLPFIFISSLSEVVTIVLFLSSVSLILVYDYYGFISNNCSKNSKLYTMYLYVLCLFTFLALVSYVLYSHRGLLIGSIIISGITLLFTVFFFVLSRIIKKISHT